MWVMYDSVTPGAIPAHAPAVAGYVGGKWPTYAELVKRFPRAELLSIAVSSSEDAECLDVENGDASVQEAPAWVDRQRQRGVERPAVYIEASKLAQLIQALEGRGIPRTAYRLIVADWTGAPHIYPGSDATQWTNAALGRNLDESLCVDGFFATQHGPYFPADEARWERELDALKGKRGPWPALRRRVLERVMRERAKKIEELAKASGWQLLNRAARYHALLERV